MNICTKRRLSYPLCVFYACAVLAGSVSSEGAVDECAPELCWSTAVVGDRCAVQCELWAKSADDDDASVVPVALADKRAPSFIRIGKSPAAGAGFVDKRYSSFVRIGRRTPPSPPPGYKRYSSFVRIGRAGALDADPPRRRAYRPLMPLDKRRHSSFVRIGRNAD